MTAGWKWRQDTKITARRKACGATSCGLALILRETPAAYNTRIGERDQMRPLHRLTTAGFRFKGRKTTARDFPKGGYTLSDGADRWPTSKLQRQRVHHRYKAVRCSECAPCMYERDKTAGTKRTPDVSLLIFDQSSHRCPASSHESNATRYTTRV